MNSSNLSTVEEINKNPASQLCGVVEIEKGGWQAPYLAGMAQSCLLGADAGIELMPADRIQCKTFI